jgi:hypothetical protein
LALVLQLEVRVNPVNAMTTVLRDPKRALFFVMHMAVDENFGFSKGSGVIETIVESGDHSGLAKAITESLNGFSLRRCTPIVLPEGYQNASIRNFVEEHQRVSITDCGTRYEITRWHKRRNVSGNKVIVRYVNGRESESMKQARLVRTVIKSFDGL